MSSTRARIERYYTDLLQTSGATRVEACYCLEDLLLADNDPEMLRLHFDLLTRDTGSAAYYDLRSMFMDRPADVVEPFLLARYDEPACPETRAGILHILAAQGSQQGLPLLRSGLGNPDAVLRRSCIIALGWIGDAGDLSRLRQRLQQDTEAELRGLAASALRQWWFRRILPATDLLPVLYPALQRESSEYALKLIIVAIQDLQGRCHGLKEDLEDHCIHGDPYQARERIIAAGL